MNETSLWLALALCACVSTDETQPKSDAAFDETAARLFDRWCELEYRPVEASTGSGGLTMEVEVTGERSMKGSARYTWQGRGAAAQSTLAWKPDSLGRMLEREGWSKDRFDADFIDDNERREFAGCSVRGVDRDDGGAVITVEGESVSGLVAMHFGADGIVTRRDHEVSGGMKFSLSPTYEEVHGRLVKVEELFAMDMGDYGSIRSTSKFEYQEVEGVLVLRSVKEKSTWNGHPAGTRSFEFKDYEIQRD